MFYLKQLLGALVMPLPLILVVMGAGILLLWATTRQAAGKVLVTVGTAFLFLAAFPPVAERLIAPLETRHPHVLDARVLDPALRWIVVLGGGASGAPDVQPHVRVEDESLFRVFEGVRLYRELAPQARLLFTGWGADGRLATAEANADVARSLGVPEDAIVIDARPRDTEEEAVAAAERIAVGEPFLLVTSAAHLPRAVYHFRSRGLDPIPAPAHRYHLPGPRSFRGHFPSARALRMTERTFHERIGTLWARLR